jgi:hypothetical protein
MINIFSDYHLLNMSWSTKNWVDYLYHHLDQQKIRSSRTSSYFFRDKNWVDHLHTVMVNKNLVHHLLIEEVVDKKKNKKCSTKTIFPSLSYLVNKNLVHHLLIEEVIIIMSTKKLCRRYLFHLHPIWSTKNLVHHLLNISSTNKKVFHQDNFFHLRPTWSTQNLVHRGCHQQKIE